MVIKCRLGTIMLLAIFLGGQVMAVDKDKSAADPKAAEAKKAITTAEVARIKAKLVDGEWRDTGKLIKQAKTAFKAGSYDKATMLANKAREEGEAGYAQAMSQQELQMPSYLKQ